MKKLIVDFIEDMKLEGKAPGTLSEYKQRLEEVADYLEEHQLTLEELEKDDILRFFKQKMNFGQKTSTIRGKMSTFRVFSLWCIKKGYKLSAVLGVDDYPKNTRVKRIRRLNDEELLVFKSYIDNLQENARAAFYCLLGSGCRVGEVAHLRPEDVNLVGRTVYIDIKDAKWGSDRRIPIADPKSAKVVWLFREGVEVDKRPLFRLSKRTLQGYATDFAKQTGITFHCHLLRHTFAALLTERGVPLTTVQFLLGHRSLGMTAHYAQSALVDTSDITPEIEL